MTQIADWIRTNRERKCMSRRQLARALRVEEITVRSWEEGEKVPRVCNQLRLRDYFEGQK